MKDENEVQREHDSNMIVGWSIFMVYQHLAIVAAHRILEMLGFIL